MTTTTEAPQVRRKRRKSGVERVVHVIGIVGRVFVAAGLLLLFFTAYLLWGTGLYTSQQQKEARSALDKKSVVSEEQIASGKGKIPPGHPAQQPRLGDALFTLRVPKIALDAVVVYGVGVDELKKGPGLFPDCAAAKGQTVGNGECTNGAKWPGESGNVAVSGHRTTYSAPFWRINELAKGDTIDFVSGRVRYRYRVRSQEIVDPTAGFTVVEQHGRSELTLTTCNPRFSATQRLIVHADYVGASLVSATPGASGAGDAAGQRSTKQAFGSDVLILAAVAVACALGSLGLSKRYARVAAYASVTLVVALGIWIAVFPRVVALLPSNY
jgi:sortase A